MSNFTPVKKTVPKLRKTFFSTCAVMSREPFLVDEIGKVYEGLPVGRDSGEDEDLGMVVIDVVGHVI